MSCKSMHICSLLNHVQIKDHLLLIVCIHTHDSTCLLQILQDLVCSSQELNYTLLIEEEGALQQVVGRYGPVLRRGPSVTVLIPVAASNLTGGRNYSLKVQVGLQLQSITTNKQHFSKL